MKNTITITSTATAVTTTTPNTPPRAATADEDDDDPLLSHDSHGTGLFFFHLLSCIFSSISKLTLIYCLVLFKNSH